MPPHRGHKYLIETGRSQVDQLSVVICHRPEEQPPVRLRAQWLSETHPDVRVLLLDDIEDEQDTSIWAENVIHLLGFVPDVLFTSEDYGDPFARSLGSKHVLVDKSRSTVPISGTEIRSHPWRHWDFLEPAVRGWYALRVCIVGAESTGKTTLAQSLADRYRTAWVPEYAREYCLRNHPGGLQNWQPAEFVHIAQTQCDRENAAARLANRILFCDTDAFSTAIWYRRYFNCRSPQVEQIASEHKHPNLHLVTDVATHFVRDEIRDGEAIRNWMHGVLLEELILQGRPFQILSGPLEHRIADAVAAIRVLGIN